MKKALAIIFSLSLIFSLTGFSVLKSGSKPMKAMPDCKQVFEDNKSENAECPFMNGEVKTSCPYLNKIQNENSSECPYMKGDAVCPDIEKNSEIENCPYLKDKNTPAKNYRTIKQTST